MKDILLTPDGDLYINGNGSIEITDSVSQAIKIRLQWFFGEWRFAPQYGIPYWEEILVKNPNIPKIRRIIRSEVLSVDEVTEVSNIRIDYNAQTREAAVSFDAYVNEEVYREEVIINV